MELALGSALLVEVVVGEPEFPAPPSTAGLHAASTSMAITDAIAIHRCFMRMDTRAGYSGMTTLERSSSGFGHFGFICRAAATRISAAARSRYHL